MSIGRTDFEFARRQKLSTRVMAGRAFAIKTPPAVQYARELTTWLTMGSQGAIVYGRPRLGKTLATRWVLRALQELLGYVPWLEIPIRSQNITSEREFFQHLLRCAKHKHYLTGTAGDKRDRWTEWLTARARRSSVSAFILFIDEAQVLTDRHYAWLVEMANELDQRGYRLFCLLVGQSSLLTKKSSFIDKGEEYEQIVGRFMLRELKFPAIASIDDLRDCYEQYECTRYPPNTDTRFPENFVPLAISAGFKLSTLAPGVWACFEKAWLSKGIGGEPVVPMHYVTSSLVGLLNTLVAEDRADLSVSANIIDQAVRKSGYLNFIKAMKIKG